MIHFLMVVVMGFILAMGVIFIVIELRSRFDSSFLIFGIANILLALFCLIDIEQQPSYYLSVGWTKLQHVIAAFFPAVLLWYLMTLVGKVHVLTLIGLIVTGVIFSLSMIGDAMFSVQDSKLTGTIFYNLLYVPFMMGSIGGCTSFLCFHYFKSRGKNRANLRWHLIGLGVLGASGIVDMIPLITGEGYNPKVPSHIVFGVLFFSIITTFLFINRLSIIIVNREHAFSKLREAYKELDHLRPIARTGQLTALFAHEVKNKSFSISLMLNSARRAAFPPSVAETLDKCFFVASDISQSGRELLAQVETDETRSTLFDIRVCLNEAVAGTLVGHHGTIVADLHLPEIFVRCDRMKLRSVFDILFTNSIQASASHLRVTAAVGNGCVAIAVEDDGKGCDPAVFDNLFTPFFTTKQDRFGTGLGLSIAQNIIQNHGGYISAYSKNIIGSGETGMIFCLTLPMSGTESLSMNGEPQILVIEEGLSQQLPEIYRILSHIHLRYRTLQTGKTNLSAFSPGIKTFCSSLTGTIPLAVDPFFIDPEVSIPVIRRTNSTGVRILTEAWALENFFDQAPSHLERSGAQL